VHNFDFRWELYPTTNELITFGIFYKSFKNAIEYVSIAQRGFASDLLQFNNTKRADVYGLELEIRKNLGFIPVSFFQNLSIIVNGALLHSRVEFADSVFQNYNDFRTPTRALQGTSPYIINAGLYYDNPSSGTQVAALYNVGGQRIAVGANAFSADIYELPRHIIDLSVTQRVTKFLVVKAGVQDLLNQSFRFFRDVNRNRRYDPQNIGPTPNFDEYVGDYVETQYKPGGYYSLGLNFTF
jgi:outer membrane receptor for ferrienterochelin and colicin